MKTTIRNAFLVFGVVLTAGCHPKQTPPENLLVVPFEHASTINLEQFVEQVTYVQLENHPESAFSDVDKLMADGSDIFMLDKKLEALFCFDTSGRFRYRIQRVGKGPGEYQELEAFWLKPDKKELWLHSFWPSKIMVYDYDGNMLREFSIRWPAGDMTGIGRGKLLGYTQTGIEAGKDQLSPGVFIMTDEGKNQHQSLILGDTTIYWLLMNQRNLEKYGDGALLLSQSDTVFYFDEEGMVKLDFILDWGRLKYPEELRDIGYRSPRAPEVMKGNYVIGKDHMIAFGPIRIFRVFLNNHMELAMANLTSGKGIYSTQMTCEASRIPLLYPIGKSTDGKLIGIYDLPLLIAMQESISERPSRDNTNGIYQTMDSLAESALGQDRPVLWFAKIKKELLINPN